MKPDTPFTPAPGELGSLISPADACPGDLIAWADYDGGEYGDHSGTVSMTIPPTPTQPAWIIRYHGKSAGWAPDGVRLYRYTLLPQAQELHDLAMAAGWHSLPIYFRKTADDGFLRGHLPGGGHVDHNLHPVTASVLRLVLQAPPDTRHEGRDLAYILLQWEHPAGGAWGLDHSYIRDFNDRDTAVPVGEVRAILTPEGGPGSA